MLREGTLVCVWHELMFSGNGVHMGRGTRAESRCLGTYLVHISPIRCVISVDFVSVLSITPCWEVASSGV